MNSTEEKIFIGKNTVNKTLLKAYKSILFTEFGIVIILNDFLFSKCISFNFNH